ncbi:unnamed protein product [Protopolystoma xenopodis]|uniref:Uncharacterized protein n=1 Tax=Protopolystoma xenopodis TaxID=117903 RepID=A0A3S5AFZ6_9PLAT|nr:unnamed protein product [Protopolystoma xenopodis]
MRTSVDGHIAGRPLSEAHKLLVSAPGGALDLSQYDYKPQIAPPTITSTQTGSADMATTGLMASEAAAGLRSPTQSRGLAEDTNTDEECERKRLRRFMRPRRNSKLDRVIAFLEDKRVKDDADIHRLDDLQMPRLRRILNIIFVTLGVCFLLAVVIVIIYTTLTK